MAFMDGRARHKLENPTEADKLKLSTAGVKTVLNIYGLGGATRDMNLEKLLKLGGDGALGEWVKRKLS